MNFEFRKRLLAGETLIGTMLTMAEPAIAEIMVASGYDWLFVDSEHGAFNVVDALPLLRACGDCPALIRIPCGEAIWIKKALDIGAAGVIVPQVNSVDEAARVVAYCKYPPTGMRGLGIGRANDYGKGFEEYLATANDDLAVIVQAEHILAVDNIEQITEVDGIDAVFVGPYDLSASMGHTGDVGHPDVVAAISRVRDCCVSKGIKLGIFAVGAAGVTPYMQQGFSLVAVGVDAIMIGQAAVGLLEEVRADQASIRP